MGLEDIAVADTPNIDGETHGIPAAEVPEDMSWFLIAVGKRKSSGCRDVVILDHSEGWAGFDIEFFWEDTFDIEPPIHLAPGAYLWEEFEIKFWAEGDAINAVGGRFIPYTASTIDALAPVVQS